jgi:shikimate dehydrogenase
MPGKFAALQVAVDRTGRAELVGSANTLVRVPGGWRADNTDVDGVRGALGAIGGPGIVVGSGGTAPAAVVALAELGAEAVTIAARSAEKAAPLIELAGRVGMAGRWCALDSPELAGLAAAAGAVVSTVPADAVRPHAHRLAAAPVLLDAIYDPWPTPLAAAVAAAGGRVVSGLEMLLNQAFAQVEQFTGGPAPKEAMRAALEQP